MFWQSPPDVQLLVTVVEDEGRRTGHELSPSAQLCPDRSTLARLTCLVVVEPATRLSKKLGYVDVENVGPAAILLGPSGS